MDRFNLRYVAPRFIPVHEWSPRTLSRFIVWAIVINFISWAITALILWRLIDGLSETVDQVDRNAWRIDRNAWKSCTELNKGFARSNIPINQAIRDERAKAHPDPVRLKALRDFRATIRDCGPEPVKP